MPKAKLRVESNLLEKFKNAAELADVKILGGRNLGATSSVEVSFKSASQLFDAGRLMETITVVPEVAKAPVKEAEPALKVTTKK